MELRHVSGIILDQEVDVVEKDLLVVGVEIQEVVGVGAIQSEGEPEGKLQSDSVEFEIVFIGDWLGVVVLLGSVRECVDDLFVPRAQVLLKLVEVTLQRELPFIVTIIYSCPGRVGVNAFCLDFLEEILEFVVDSSEEVLQVLEPGLCGCLDVVEIEGEIGCHRESELNESELLEAAVPLDLEDQRVVENESVVGEIEVDGDFVDDLEGESEEGLDWVVVDSECLVGEHLDVVVGLEVAFLHWTACLLREELVLDRLCEFEVLGVLEFVGVQSEHLLGSVHHCVVFPEQFLFLLLGHFPGFQQLQLLVGLYVHSQHEHVLFLRFEPVALMQVGVRQTVLFLREVVSLLKVVSVLVQVLEGGGPCNVVSVESVPHHHFLCVLEGLFMLHLRLS